MKKTVSFYYPETGLFHGNVTRGDEVQIEANRPAGTVPIEGAFDHLSERVDLATGKVVDYRPPAPADAELETFSWDEGIRRWVGAPTMLARANAQRARRDALLSACDWTIGSDSPLSAAKKAEWVAYRQLLRDVPDLADFPDDFAWPAAPA